MPALSWHPGAMVAHKSRRWRPYSATSKSNGPAILGEKKAAIRHMGTGASAEYLGQGRLGTTLALEPGRPRSSSQFSHFSSRGNLGKQLLRSLFFK